MPNPVLRSVRPLAVAALLAAGTPALATVQRTFVASHGSDADPCSLAQPCHNDNGGAQTQGTSSVIGGT